MTASWSVTELPYQYSARDWYERLRHLPMAVLLDSGIVPSAGKNEKTACNLNSRFDVVTAMPACRIEANVTRERTGKSRLHMDITDYTGRVNVPEAAKVSDPFRLIDTLQDRYRPPENANGPPGFAGGGIGYFSYDLGRFLHDIELRDIGACEKQQCSKLSPTTSPTIPPALCWGIYEWNILIDHLQQTSFLILSPEMTTDQANRVKHCVLSQPTNVSASAEFCPLSPPTCHGDRQHYHQAFSQIMRYIRQGDCYQVNLSRRFSFPYEGDSWPFYQQVMKTNGWPFSAYLDMGPGKVISFSPERFLRVVNRQVTTEPIKGTRPRGKNPVEDQKLAMELKHSQKDLAENLMIVDLLRNDLGQVCVPGSISVPELQTLKTFDNVHHLVSKVTGRLREEASPMDLMRSCLPGGSITGAPKKRAMEIIEELESSSRGVYCGVIACYGFDRTLDSNIAIRTLFDTGSQIHFSAGGGIVSDSLVEEEYIECEDKIDFIYEALRAASSKNSLNSS